MSKHFYVASIRVVILADSLEDATSTATLATKNAAEFIDTETEGESQTVQADLLAISDAGEYVQGESERLYARV